MSLSIYLLILHKNNIFFQRFSWLCNKILFGWWNLGPDR